MTEEEESYSDNDPLDDQNYPDFMRNRQRKDNSDDSDLDEFFEDRSQPMSQIPVFDRYAFRPKLNMSSQRDESSDDDFQRRKQDRNDPNSFIRKKKDSSSDDDFFQHKVPDRIGPNRFPGRRRDSSSDDEPPHARKPPSYDSFSHGGMGMPMGRGMDMHMGRGMDMPMGRGMGMPMGRGMGMPMGRGMGMPMGRRGMDMDFEEMEMVPKSMPPRAKPKLVTKVYDFNQKTPEDVLLPFYDLV